MDQILLFDLHEVNTKMKSSAAPAKPQGLTPWNDHFSYLEIVGLIQPSSSLLLFDLSHDLLVMLT